MFTTTNQAKSPASNSVNRIVRRLLKGLFYIFYILVVIILLISAVLIAFRWQASFRERQTRIEAAPQTGQFVQAGDVEVFIQEMGPASGPAVLFIHGTGAWSEIWRETMRDLAQAGFHTVALDLPPFGFSERPAAPLYDRSDQAKRIIGVLDALEISDVILVGHSFGAGPTVEAALLIPDRVERLVLVDAALGLEQDEKQRQDQPSLLNGLLAIRPLRNAVIATVITNPLFTKRLLQSLILNPDDATESQVEMLQQQLVIKDSTNAMGDWLLEFLSEPEASLSSDLASYQTLEMPTLIIWGDSDTIVPLSQGEYLESMISDSELAVLPQVGHIPHIEETEQFNEVLAEFLSKHRP